LFTGSHLLAAQKPTSECFIRELFIKTFAQRSDYLGSLAITHYLMQSEGYAQLEEFAEQRIRINQSETQ